MKILVKKRPLLFWLILIAIALLGLLSGQFIFEQKLVALFANRKVRYLLLFLIISLIMALGYYSWKKFGDGWQHKIWLLFYAVSLSALGVFGFIDQFVYPFTYPALVQLHHYRVFLLSSLPYIILYLLTCVLPVEKRKA